METRAEGRTAYVVSELYWYVVAVIGVGLLIGGAVTALFGVRTLVLPRGYEAARDGGRLILVGLAFVLPGLALLWTHLRAARRREGGPFTEAFWGASLYYHLVSLIALGFVLVGTIGLLVSLVDLAVPRCFPQGVATYGDEAGYVEGTIRSDCFEPAASVSLRQMLDFAIFLIVAGPVFWWHLRQGRRLVGRPQAA